MDENIDDEILSEQNKSDFCADFIEEKYRVEAQACFEYSDY